MTREELANVRNDLLTELKKEKVGEKENTLPMYRCGYVDGVLDYYNKAVVNEGGVVKEVVT